MIRFNQYDDPNIEFKKAIKKPLPISCVQMDEEFEVATLEGIMKGKKGDWLMKGVNGELYPCAHDIFIKSYDLIE
ncbi:MAG: hypothetical protein KJO49_05770 [Bacteroidia bacterium]|nr:hypothetical protein [Bacteroidia bacterium]MBT8267700.1 hypothetical protein [Bacteroidia bacterium]NNF81607.1 hypothetical protein [Flavobacteriaceae bacterium]NNK71228.1 hypothetical protein [Flavobacteriaceae bacterium]NNL78952.1 hypothetical protein [Flavobacteriaceae bacterium]